MDSGLGNPERDKKLHFRQLDGRREATPDRRYEVQRDTFERRKRFNQAVRDAFKKRASPP